jgi:hypothetical protein
MVRQKTYGLSGAVIVAIKAQLEIVPIAKGKGVRDASWQK